MNNTSLYTIIVTYNAMKWIDKCLLNLFQSSIHTEIVIVDNCSTDNTVSYIKSNYPSIILIENNRNVGFGQANNQGIEYAYKKGATHFFLCNQDLYVDIDALNILVNTQEKYNLDILSPIHLNGTHEDYDKGFFGYFVVKSEKYQRDILLGKLDEVYFADHVNAAAWLLPRNTIEKIGGFDPVFFHYGEDSNYIKRVQYHNGKIGVAPNSFVCHDRGQKGNINAFNTNAPLASLLYLYTFLDKPIMSFNVVRFSAHIALLKNILKYTLKFQFRKSSQLICSYYKFYKCVPKIIKSVKVNRNIGANWLRI